LRERAWPAATRSSSRLPPLEGAFLTPLCSETRSDAEGRFELRHLERSALQLFVFALGFAEQCLPLAPGAEDAALETRVVLSRGDEVA
jgi:hypothetical protein